MKMKRLNLLMIILCALFYPFHVYAADTEVETQDIRSFLNKLFDERTHFLIDQRPKDIYRFYDKTEKSGQYAYEQELLRSKYINAWAEKRGIVFATAENSIRINRIKKEGNLARISLNHSLQLSYVYKIDNNNLQFCGIGTRHVLTLKKIKGEWLVLREWYTDPLTENPKLIPEFNGFPNPAFLKSETITVQTGDNGKRRYNRERALEYANKYAGAAWGAGNDHRYNKKYLDYTYHGGDCTNFASQVLGDENEGGGLKMVSGWHYRSEGSQAWVRTDSFKNFVIHSGYGRLISKGYFTDVVKPTEKYPSGAVAALKPGDLIAYEMDGDIDHFAILVGFDYYGYPLVNSHTADRYRVPFDLGWDKNTKYLLIHIND
ncbi:Putative amidase domain-containing protein [Paenibacillus sp. yr247]|uniref:amidase domain-containing protein n=1 Tax=Paenibacillus sp. yr247 TaxID=1761880 RepID=UPI000890F91B|nr:amidase domain-containing protein [Paenibacillus sp. yr247]SDN94030.1 Putative amidase domain-containing protein [Paenibacillus sp. yr247]